VSIFIPSHGEYEIDSKGEIIIVRFTGTWNKECSEELIERCIPFIENKKVHKFGVLADLQNFEGATPDAAKRLIELSLWGSKNGQVARAQIINTEYKYFVVKDMQNLNIGYPIKDFLDAESDFQCFDAQGLKTTDS
jgi:hypothetical protein